MEKKPGPCAVEKPIKGYYCVDDQKELFEPDLKAGMCPMCSKKPEKTEYCVKTVPGQKDPDRARVTYACTGCTAVADFEHELKHEESCKKKTVPAKKVCSKSGTAPHQTIPK